MKGWLEGILETIKNFALFSGGVVLGWIANDKWEAIEAWWKNLLN